MTERTNLKVLGLIGARSGSRGLPHKNIKFLAGKPLLAWIIEAAKNSKYTNRVIVSTDSEEYANIARAHGAEVPFLRPQDIAGDKATDFEYITHALNWLEVNEGYRPDIVLRLLPTSPLQRPEDIDACIQELIQDPGAHSALVVAEARQHPHKALKLIGDEKKGQRLVSYITENGRDVTPVVRQAYPKAYFRANVIASRIGTIRDMRSLTGDHVRFHIIPQERAVDIDSPMDFFLAGKLMEKFKESSDTTLI